ncbi:hypothetical protein SUGI_0875590 [Cryptomeria japonica]|uniref:uncharacterized protein LOC131054839 isoform X2 n=1 Tax=Cryptomeria japonica TaxID=3369 RepID=UPI0024149522|nr:uncharacterized protein LOC131054839 isoform X2 [Cryptomeria japonica]GLJ42297.1 hypothetical protein SUGI_0875590 [Cryptomeria japonica]
MAAEGKPFVKYHWLSTNLLTSVLVQNKKHKFSLQSSSNTLHNYCLSLLGHIGDVLTTRHIASGSRTLVCSISRSVIEPFSGGLGLCFDAQENSYSDNSNGLLFNFIVIDSWKVDSLLSRPEKVDATELFGVNGQSFDPGLNGSSSFSSSGRSKFQFQKSIQQVPLFHLCSSEHAGISFLSSSQNISSGLFLESGDRYVCGERVKCATGAKGWVCDSTRPCDHLKELCRFGRLCKGQICSRFDVTEKFQLLRFVLGGISGGLESFSEKFKGKTVNKIPKSDGLRVQPTSKPLNIISDNHCKKFAISMNDLCKNVDKERTSGIPASTSELTPVKLHHCLKHLCSKNISSITFEGISDSATSLQKLAPPVCSSLEKESGLAILADRSTQFSELVRNKESLRIDSHSQKGNSESPFPKPGTNALAGALAGTFVSLWLHPIDTVKTVIQSRSVGHRSVFRNLGSILSERGMVGLYRGIGSNLASSAPISGIYTFTYESVKAALLPHLAKEYHAFAHCIAGGCASIATSFIYTPTDCIKQQMQVGSQYRNSWLALRSVIDKGGFPMLYAGWGAVLCRNVPQSVIKFYTYEGLKHFAMRNHTKDKQLSTLQTLAFGGLAGSTAALFTTPFDVIKTRLQTQIPGSPTYYEGVFQAFEHIAKREGLGGLYRGLLPRLVIYISQGALFFASYEFFKRVLSIEVRRLAIQTTQPRGAELPVNGGV